MTVTMKFEGGKELEAALMGLATRATARNTAMRALKLAATPIRDRWADLVPEDQGDLKRAVKIGNAIKAVQKAARGDGDVVTTFIGIDESQDRRLHIYAGVQEFGNDSNPPQPAGRPAWEEKKNEALNRLASDLWSEIDKTAARAARKAARLAARGA